MLANARTNLMHNLKQQLVPVQSAAESKREPLIGDLHATIEAKYGSENVQSATEYGFAAMTFGLKRGTQALFTLLGASVASTRGAVLSAALGEAAGDAIVASYMAALKNETSDLTPEVEKNIGEKDGEIGKVLDLYNKLRNPSASEEASSPVAGSSEEHVATLPEDGHVPLKDPRPTFKSRG
ncbi:hypothetical protein M436DRAFT_83157 [Aureobasidium namibiae CBS 147.97]|uniref:Uncharacterized protein n=1 Tax=Aureobasidium namibiae CBS 147.97 TaxID=1043004 RepID=A0A074WRD4_9PEZI